MLMLPDGIKDGGTLWAALKVFGALLLKTRPPPTVFMFGNVC